MDHKKGREVAYGESLLIATQLNTHITTPPDNPNILEWKTSERALPKYFLPIVSGLLKRGGQIVKQTKKEAGHAVL